MARIPLKLEELIDGVQLRADLAALAAGGEAASPAVRAQVLQLLRERLVAGRRRAEALLAEDGGGTACAVRLSHLMDEIVRALHDFAVGHACTAPAAARRMAVVAVGGYGRGTLAPGSDIDLLFLLHARQTPEGERLVEYMLYMLWDMGLKVGHATRTIEECMRLSRSDITIRTAILEARFVAADEALFDELIVRFDHEVVKDSGAEYVQAKLAERDARHAKAGESRYLVEPNVKDGKGGLRDLQTLFWVAKYFYRVRTAGELVEKGVFTAAEYRQFLKAEDFLWAVRCHMHFLTGKAEERLHFDIQSEIAARLGYTTHPGLSAVERFMKHYFLVAKAVGDLTRIFCAALEEEQANHVPGFNRIFLTFSRRRRKLAGTSDFIVDNHRINVADDQVFVRDPVNLVRLFWLADKHGLELHPDALRLITRSLDLVTRSLRRDARANQLFMDILTSDRNPELNLRRMNEAGLLGRLIPDFGRIVAMMQFSMYHHYTVDEHLLRCIGVLSEIERGGGEKLHPLSHTLLPGLRKHREALYVAVLLHDVAKGRTEDHAIAGARIAKRLCPHMGLSAADTEIVAWLVEHHLLMSMTAQTRDLNDRKTIEDFASVVQSVERLKLLLVLTVCDIRGVGPGVWNGWKSQLLRELYFETEAVLQGGDSTLNRGGRAAAAKHALCARLSGWSEAARKAYAARHTEGYWLSFDTDTHERHARLIEDAKDTALTVAVEPAPMRDITEITLYAQDHPGLFSRFVGACAILGMNIVDAKIFTTRDGMALDVLWVQDQDGGAISEERRIRRLEDTIRKVLAGEIMPPDLIEQRFGRENRTEAFTIAPQVYIDNNASDDFTVIEVNGLDRPGLVHALTKALFHLGLTIGSAHIATFGERAVDVFYVKDVIGHKVTNANKKKAVERHLLEALADPVRKARPARARRRDDIAAAE